MMFVPNSELQPSVRPNQHRGHPGRPYHRRTPHSGPAPDLVIQPIIYSAFPIFCLRTTFPHQSCTPFALESQAFINAAFGPKQGGLCQRGCDRAKRHRSECNEQIPSSAHKSYRKSLEEYCYLEDKEESSDWDPKCTDPLYTDQNYSESHITLGLEKNNHLSHTAQGGKKSSGYIIDQKEISSSCLSLPAKMMEQLLENIFPKETESATVFMKKTRDTLNLKESSIGNSTDFDIYVDEAISDKVSIQSSPVENSDNESVSLSESDFAEMFEDGDEDRKLMAKEVNRNSESISMLYMIAKDSMIRLSQLEKRISQLETKSVVCSGVPSPSSSSVNQPQFPNYHIHHYHQITY